MKTPFLSPFALPCNQTMHGARHAFLAAAALAICLSLPAHSQDSTASTSAPAVGSSTPESQTAEVDTGRQSAPFRFSVEARGGYDSNSTTSSIEEEESLFAGAYASLNGTIDSPRTFLKLGVLAGGDYYFDRSEDQEDVRANLSVEFSHLLNPRITLSYNGVHAYEPDPDFSNSFSNTRRSGDYFYTSNNLGFSYAWSPRFSTITHVGFFAIVYTEDKTEISDDRIELTGGQEFRYLVAPATGVSAEYRYTLVEYGDSGASERNSSSHYILAGFDHTLNPRSTIYFRGGATLREYDGLGNQTSPYGEFNLTYELSQATSVTWTNRYSIEESSVGNGLSNDTFRTGLQLSHAFGPRLRGTAAVYYANNEYTAETEEVESFTEDNLDTSVGLEFFVSPNISLYGNASYTSVSSDESFREYDRIRGMLGLRSTF